MLATGCTKLATGCTKLATGFPNDWVDQTMSCQLIQTTSFAMHPRLIEYNAVALDWMYKLPAGSYRECKTLSFQLIQATSFFNRQLHISSAESLSLRFC
ncbi:hypothetical protein F511_47197 [Dorcoceras hygrometricum]|uniref:Uncharacterized protein n=1 Tax=Dorcoceras hygrometricum TaxID=472368 RepID=A0A2Z6ZY05_9LAMI|nr:hypothetical protein F511_47197 [Dorcoceras hygrometricum]